MEFVPVLYIEWGKTFRFELDCIHKVETWKRFAMLKKAQKVLLPAKENFTTIFKKHVHESWRSLLQFFILKKGNYFYLDLHHVHKMETGQRHTFKNAYCKKCFYPQTKILQRFSKNTYMSHGCVSSRLSYWKKATTFA